MAEVLGLGASAVAFTGLAGQILQGCHYICHFIDNIRDAPDDLKHYNLEINGFRSAVLGFQEILRDLGYSPEMKSSVKHAMQALESGSSLIKELQLLLRKYENDGTRDLWKDLKFARRSDFEKCVKKLEESKADILLAQSRINL
jgi:hypothetical protein